VSSRKLPCILLAVLVAGYLAVLFANAPGIGFTRDEGYYFKAAEEYGAWWDTLFSKRFLEAFGDAEIKHRFGYNTEHPALVKLAQGLTHRVLTDWLGLTRPSSGYRAAGMFFAALSLLATFLLGRAIAGPWVGLLAAAMLATIPRYFFDAHLACFDVPMTAMWTLGLWAFLRAYRRPESLRRAAFAGVVFGLALATKLNALFLPFVFVGIWLVHGRLLAGVRLVSGASGGRDVLLPALPWALVLPAVIGPLVFVAHWPYLWHDTFARIGAYLAFHLHHEHYPISYFHALLVRPPFPVEFPFVMTWYTAPSPLVLVGGLAWLAAVVRVVRRRRAEEALLVLATLIPFVAIALPSSPIFGGVKHWYNAMPTLAILAARAVLDGAAAIGRAEPGRRVAAIALSILVLLPGVLGIAASPTTGIGYYNELAGGYRGGAELGMQRGFWGGLFRPTLPRIAALPPGARVFFNRANYDSYRMYLREGLLPSHVYYANDGKRATAGINFEQPEHGEKEGEIWSSVGPRPVAGVYVDEVTMTQLYVRED